MGNGFGVFLIFVGIVATFFFVLRFRFAQAQSLDHTYERVARRLGGASAPGGFWGQPHVLFRFAGAPAKIDTYSTGGKHAKYYTQINLPWSDPHIRCEIYPENFLHGVGKMLGMKDIQIGSAEFDHHFMISGNSPKAIRQLLNHEVQFAVTALRRFLGNDDVYVSFRGGRLLVKKRSLIRDESSLQRFVQLAIGLHDAATATHAEGIDFVQPDQTHATLSLDAAVCQVCGDDVKADAVFCRSCKTPHHRDCWLYYGSCSTYGCGQTKFLVEKKAT